MHVWLHPENARRIVWFIAQQLSVIYPSNQRYLTKKMQKNYIEKIDAVDLQIKTLLAGLQDKAFIVFHDAYQYFEYAYGLRGVGSITFEPHLPSSPARIKEVRKKLKATGAQCVFREPQFSDRLVNIVTEGSNVKKGILDPLGANLNGGEDLYITLLHNLAKKSERMFKLMG